MTFDRRKFRNTLKFNIRASYIIRIRSFNEDKPVSLAIKEDPRNFSLWVHVKKLTFFILFAQEFVNFIPPLLFIKSINYDLDASSGILVELLSFSSCMFEESHDISHDMRYKENPQENADRIVLKTLIQVSMSFSFFLTLPIFHVSSHLSCCKWIFLKRRTTIFQNRSQL